MPELPEVNTMALALDAQLKGDSIIVWEKMSAKLRQPIPSRHDIESFLNRPIISVRRIAKSIYFDFGCGIFLHVHLGMTGSFLLQNNAGAYEKHEHLRLSMSSGRSLSYFDPRRFGVISVTGLPAKIVCEPFADQLTPGYLQEVCSGSRRCIKALIMDQKIIAGLGNIYASEALFQAGILPFREAESLGKEEIRRLCHCIIKVIAAAIESGCKSLLPDFDVNAATTHFPIETLVYGRDGEKCSKCRRVQIMRVSITGRSSCYCPYCQI